MTTRKAVIYSFAFFLFVLIVPKLCAQNDISMSPGEAAITRQKLVDYSKLYIGKPYASGGIGPNSFDCSGLIFTVSRESIGIQLPRTTKAIFSFCKDVDDSSREAGDLVFFKTTSSGDVSHVGLYIGSNQFIHAASDGPNTGVIISSLKESYWKSHYYCTRRYLPASNSELLGDSGSAQKSEWVKVTREDSKSDASKSESAKKVSHAQGRRASGGHPFLSKVSLDSSLCVDWSFFTPDYFRLNCRGFDLMLHASYTGVSFQPGIGTYFRYDAGTKNFQFPLVLSLTPNEYLRVFAGPVLSTSGARLPGGSDHKTKTSFFPGIIGLCFSTPSFQIGKTLVSFIQDIHYTVFNETDGSALSLRNSLTTGIVFASGIKITLPLKNVL